MKILLCIAVFLLGFVKSEYIYSTKDAKYNFNCLEDNQGICQYLKQQLSDAVEALSEIINFEEIYYFEAFVDDLSKYRINTNKETIAVALNDEFAPLTTADTNIQSPYPNAAEISKNISQDNTNDFVIVLNNFKSDDEFLNAEHNDIGSSIIAELFEELKSLDKLVYPYVIPSTTDRSEFDKFFSRRQDDKIMQAYAENVTKKCIDLVNGEKLNTIVHWDDTLIYKGQNIRKNTKNHVVKIIGNIKYNIHKIIHKSIQKNKTDSKSKNNKKVEEKYNRIVALGDIHGDYEHLIKILRHAKLIDKKKNWIGNDTILIQVGDLIDRGNNTLKIYDTMIDLREQAQKKGGIVYMLLGNHELFQLYGNHIFSSLKDYDSFGGWRGLEEALGPEGKLGKFIRQEMNVTMVVGDSLFTHGGLYPEFVEEGVDKINEKAREILLNTPSIDVLYESYYLKNLTHPIMSDPIFGDTGPLWTRDLVKNPEEEVCSILEKTLELTNTKRMIVGHTVQPFGKIRTRCDNKLIAIDIGISRCIAGGYYGYLEILNDKKEIWARYLN